MKIYNDNPAVGVNNADNKFDSSLVVGNRDGSLLERSEFIISMLTGGAGDLRVTQSVSGTVEQDGTIQFSIGLMDINSGAIASDKIDLVTYTAGIDITRKRGAATDTIVSGGTLNKADGIVYYDYKFVSASWEVGDIYIAKMYNIACDIGTAKARVPTMIWSNAVTEIEDIKNEVKYLYSTADGGTHTYPDSVVQESIFAYVMSKATDPVVTSYDNTTDSLEAIRDKLDTMTTATGAGVLQMAATTKDLQQAAGTYDLFTCSTQAVVVEKLVFALPNVNVSDDVNITYITIQTNHSTPQVIFNSTTGAKANLTAENQLSWDGAIYMPTGKKIQLTIAGGAADASTVCNITAQYRAVVSGGSLTS